jgi:arachidonate 15-lipoxygenase
VCQLLEETYGDFDITLLDPERDAERRGVVGAGFDTPAQDNRRALFEVMHAHALRYLRLYYGSDAQLREDASFRAWVEELDRLIPGGTRKLLGAEATVESAARLCAVLLYLGSVEHEILGTGLWDYQMWHHVQPVRLYRNGRRMPRDVYQRLVNANFTLNVRRTQLLEDFSYLALDEKGAQAMTAFRADLQALQERMAQEPPARWRILPDQLEANMNA